MATVSPSALCVSVYVPTSVFAVDDTSVVLSVTVSTGSSSTMVTVMVLFAVELSMSVTVTVKS